MENPIIKAVKELNPLELLSVISTTNNRLSTQQLDSIFFTAVQALSEKSTTINNGAQMVYLLRNLGAPINHQNENADTPLLCYLQSENLQSDIVEAFLRCNADVNATNNDGHYPLELVRVNPNIPKSVHDVFMKYIPGIWEAVEGDDAMNVRKLVNQWSRVDVQQNGKSLLQLALEVGNESIIRVVSCIRPSMPGIWEAVEGDDAMNVRKLVNQWSRVDVQQNGKSLLQLALEVGNESIIRVVSCIRPSMNLAHGVLSGDVKAVKNVLESKKKLNINFRNMGDKGATPLYYSIKQGNREIVELLLENGARLDLGMKGEIENDIPMYFAMLALVPRVNNELLKLVIPKGPIGIDHIFYNGKNVLFHCIDYNVHHDVIDYILHIGSAHLVTQYTQDNICARDYAVKLKAEKIVQVIDKNVCRWIVEGKENRKILFLHNYQHIPQVILTKEEEEAFSCLPDYYDQISKFHDAVENSDYETTHYLLDFIDSRVFGILETCLADSRRQGDGQPAIHKAVLRHNIQIVQLLAETLVYQQKQRLDSIRDQSFRTPLHYAYGMENERILVNLLLDYGASEFSVDKNGHSPLEFKDRRGERLMEGLLEYQYDQYLNEPEPDPWSIPLSIPILGYFLSCSHPTHLSTIIPSKQSSSLTASLRRRSVPEMKLRKIASRSASIASHLANFTEALRSRLAQRSYHRHSTDKEYFPIPSDENKLEEDPDNFLLNGEADDLLTEKEIKKSSSCLMQ